MKSCAFFGHRKLNIEPYERKILSIVTELIEEKGVTRFYSGYRGAFDIYCSNLIHTLKERYPNITNTMVLSYIPVTNSVDDYGFKLPKCFDDSVYLLERRVPERFAVIETNKLLVNIADYIVAGVITHGGGAYKACEYAHKRKKPIISIIDDWEV